MLVAEQLEAELEALRLRLVAEQLEVELEAPRLALEAEQKPQTDR